MSYDSVKIHLINRWPLLPPSGCWLSHQWPTGGAKCSCGKCMCDKYDPDEIVYAIISTVCANFGIDFCDMVSDHEKLEFRLPRELIMFFCRELTDMDLDMIGSVTKDGHAVVMAAISKITNLISTKENLRPFIRYLEQEILEQYQIKRELDYTKEDLRTALKKLFSCLEFDQLIWGIPDHYDLCMDADEEEVVNVVADYYTEKLYPAILDAFDEHIPYMKGHDADGREFFDHTFLYHPAVQIFYGIDEAVYSGVTGTPIEKWDEVNGNVSAQSQDMVPANDFSQLQNQQSEIWGAVKEILVRLSNIN